MLIEQILPQVVGGKSTLVDCLMQEAISWVTLPRRFRVKVNCKRCHKERWVRFYVDEPGVIKIPECCSKCETRIPRPIAKLIKKFYLSGCHGAERLAELIYRNEKFKVDISKLKKLIQRFTYELERKKKKDIQKEEAEKEQKRIYNKDYKGKVY